MENRILIVEDDLEIVGLLEIHMKDLNATVDSVNDGRSALEKALAIDYDLILLDLSIPIINGVEVCRELRKTKDTPVIMVTAKSEEIDKVLGLEIGADDYITKPFSIRELKARAKAVMRRSEKSAVNSAGESDMDFGDLKINVEMRRVTLDGHKVELSPKEFELLVLLAGHPGRSYSRSELLDVIWGYNFSGYEHTVNSHVNRLRAKIEPDMSHPIYILTTWGIGYRFNEEI
ncbi:MULTISPECIES: response regulator transcription factor [Nonlabens]|uniref:Phosphate regulon transcriptional regulatory protein PhoB n=1 Tax=Nonlabens xylanidelens TaxID=191564 RepID=A0A2S6IPN2_9FLAO|nr:response regulator transcription factor [Nonlabens xylanidelens]PPK96189.1 DNA-binding response OmpR family regulator [Nonlabens xylanidelens]PQJ17932.1 DNA-binding response regulator [Nonlabens xylanidelens]